MRIMTPHEVDTLVFGDTAGPERPRSAMDMLPILSILSVVALNCQARCSCISADCQLSRLCTLYLQPGRTPTTGTLTVSLVSSSAYSRLNFLKVGVSFLMTDD